MADWEDQTLGIGCSWPIPFFITMAIGPLLPRQAEPPAAKAIRQLPWLPAPRSRKASRRELARRCVAPTPAWRDWSAGLLHGQWC